MRRVVFTPVLLVMAAVASSASVATTGVRAQAKDRITSASNPPDAVKGLSPQHNATQPTGFRADPTPVLTEFYGAAKPKSESKPPMALPVSTPQASVNATITPASD